MIDHQGLLVEHGIHLYFTTYRKEPVTAACYLIHGRPDRGPRQGLKVGPGHRLGMESWSLSIKKLKITRRWAVRKRWTVTLCKTSQSHGEGSETSCSEISSTTSSMAYQRRLLSSTAALVCQLQPSR